MVKQIEKLSVLVVDDNELAMGLMKKILERLGVRRVDTAPDGQAALDLLGKTDEKIDVVLSDWQMPKMDGLELLNEARRLMPDIHFVMVTGKRDIGLLQSAVNSKVDAFLCKPFTPQQLAEQLKSLRPPPLRD